MLKFLRTDFASIIIIILTTLDYRRDGILLQIELNALILMPFCAKEGRFSIS